MDFTLPHNDCTPLNAFLPFDAGTAVPCSLNVMPVISPSSQVSEQDIFPLSQSQTEAEQAEQPNAAMVDTGSSDSDINDEHAHDNVDQNDVNQRDLDQSHLDQNEADSNSNDLEQNVMNHDEHTQLSENSNVRDADPIESSESNESVRHRNDVVNDVVNEVNLNEISESNEVVQDGEQLQDPDRIGNSNSSVTLNRGYCTGCDKQFKGLKGLRCHQTHTKNSRCKKSRNLHRIRKRKKKKSVSCERSMYVTMLPSQCVSFCRN